MRVLDCGTEDWSPNNELGDVVERICYYREFFADDPQIARKYWSFVVRSYLDKGYEIYDVEELVAEADEFFENSGEMPEVKGQLV